jgi:hypothetical protein
VVFGTQVRNPAELRDEDKSRLRNRSRATGERYLVVKAENLQTKMERRDTE